MSEKLKACLRRQEDLFDRIKKAQINYKKSSKERLTTSFIETKSEALEKLWSSFLAGHDEIVSELDKEDKAKLVYFTEDVYTQTEYVYEDYKTRLKDDLHTRKPAQTSHRESDIEIGTSGRSNEVKLPQIHLPKFSHGYEEWQTFHDMFESLIHKNVNLSAVQKLHYLKSCLSGEAEILLKNLSTTEVNYSEAWSQLIRRYNNKRYNTNEIMKRLFTQKNIASETPTALKQLLDTTSACLKSLQNLQIDITSWDAIINYLIVSKLDSESRKLWEIEVSRVSSDDTSDELPTWEQLKKFLEMRFRTLEMLEPSHTYNNRSSTRTSQNNNTTKQNIKQRSFHTSLQEERKSFTCAMCAGPHALYQCKQFAMQTPEKRSEYVQSKGMCFNCLSTTHAVKNCQISTSCRRCGRRHHTLLHFEKTNNPGSATAESSSYEKTSTEVVESRKPHETKVVAHFTQKSQQNRVLLATAMVKIKSPTGYSQTVRALIDQGSEASFVSAATAQSLKLKGSTVNGVVSGIGDGQTRIKNMVSFQIESLHNPKFSVPVNAYVLKRLTSFLPSRETAIPNWPDIANLPLADPMYGTPGKIDVILGAEVYCEILLEGLLKHSTSNGPVAQNTQLGWILSGKIGNDLSAQQDRNIISMHVQLTEDQLLRQFWEIEREPDRVEKRKTREEIRCEEIFEESTYRNDEGRYVVRLPFKTSNPECKHGQSKEIALRRFESLEKRLLKHPNLQEEYKNVIQDYIDQGHMCQITEQRELEDPYVVYLPHHAVIRNDKETSKVRVVFDASSKGVNNISLNDNLLVGPKLQDDLRHILMRWRKHQICIVADLVQMYRQVVVDERDTDFQRILWRTNSDDAIQHYKLLRLTFGTSCAPYLAVKSLQQLAKDEQAKYPLAANITLQDYYMDDLLTGCEAVEQAIEIYEQMNQLMRAGGFELQKWCSNSHVLLNHISHESQRPNHLIAFKSSDSIKVLGLYWNKTNDQFEYHFQLLENDEARRDISKRIVLSEISRLYDPMGWIAPIIITAKIFMQKLWKSKLAWDESLTPQLLIEWQQFKIDLPSVKKIAIPRWLQGKETDDVELHAFADASQSAYAAAVYLKTKNSEGSTSVNLVTAKTKVAPVERQISIPRLELCAALLAAKLVYEVSQIMNIPQSKIFAWSDSTVVLAWIAGEPGRWTTFVSNRTSEILTSLDRDQWRHVRTDQNPADIASRGLPAPELSENQLWWHGPNWLQSDNHKKTNCNNFETTEETRAIKTLTATVNKKDEFIWTRFSSLSKMLRVLSYCKRFLNLRKPKDQRIISNRTVNKEETEEILQFCTRETQAMHFQEEINCLRSGQSVSKRSQLYTLHPVLDENGVLRVGGRIHEAQEKYDKRHPVILPSDSHLTMLIIRDAHQRTLHGGPQLMLNFLRSKYWLIRARDKVKKYFRNCITCVRYSQQNNTQLMGQLPEDRLKPMRPFKISGVDFTGHINLRFSPGRGTKSYKGYICLFICFFSKAIHLEAVSDLTSSGFIAAFRRFVSRRGHCQTLYSDNGTNFIGAAKELREMFDRSKSQLPDELHHLLANEGTTWKFIPPRAPNFGGLWEAGVRSAKTHLKKVIGDSTLTFEELTTLLTQIEACLNSRPLSYLSDNPDDPMPLTPGHFIIGEPLLTIPDETYEEKDNISNLRRWKYCQKMMNDFWKKWSNEYLVTLNQRYKWTTKKTEPEIDDIVIIRDKNIPPAKWWLGRIVEKHKGKDNITRVVSIKTKNGVCKRACNNLCFLPKSTE